MISAFAFYAALSLVIEFIGGIIFIFEFHYTVE